MKAKLSYFEFAERLRVNLAYHNKSVVDALYNHFLRLEDVLGIELSLDNINLRDNFKVCASAREALSLACGMNLISEAAALAELSARNLLVTVVPNGQVIIYRNKNEIPPIKQ